MMPRPQQFQALAQRRARHPEFFREAPLRGQQLAGLQYAIDDQAFDTFTDHIRHLMPPRIASVHAPSTGMTSCEEKTRSNGSPSHRAEILQFL